MNIIEMAREAGIHVYPEFEKAFERFAELVRADEREECAKVCEPQEEHDDPLTSWKIAKAIRARGTT
jgi:hypothetical protein